MPYGKRKRGSKIEVYNRDTGKVMGTFDSDAAANKQLAALYANVKKANSTSVDLTMTVKTTPEVAERFKRYLALLQRAAGIGHSNVFGMWLDGDGSDAFKVEGLELPKLKEDEVGTARGSDVEIVKSLPTPPGSWSGFLRITKALDEEQHIVEGYASSENLDLQSGKWPEKPKPGERQVAYEGDVVSSLGMARAIKQFLAWGTLKIQHDDTTTPGVILEARVIKGDVTVDGEVLHNPTYVKAKVSDPLAWQKVKDKVLKGFSINADVFDLDIRKMFGKTVRFIKDFVINEISLVDRPALPVAKVVLWKSMNPSMRGKGDAMPKVKQTQISKADPDSVLKNLQDLRDQAELEGDLDKAKDYAKAIRHVLEAEGMDDEEPEEGGDAYHDAPNDGDGEDGGGDGEGDGDAAPEHETPEDKADEADESSLDADTTDDEDQAKKALDTDQPAPDAETKVKKAKKAKVKKSKHGKDKKAKVEKSAPVETVTKADLAAQDEKVTGMVKALAGDIARIADYINENKERPVLREIVPLTPGTVGDEITVLKKALEDTSDTAQREALGHLIAQREIAALQPNVIKLRA